MGQAGFALLVGRFGSQLTGDGRFAGQLRVRTNQAQLLIDRGVADGAGQGMLEVCQGLEGTLDPGPAGNPRRVFINAIEQGCKLVLIGCIELVEGQSHVVSALRGEWLIGVMLAPVSRDVDATSHPDLVVLFDVVQELL